MNTKSRAFGAILAGLTILGGIVSADATPAWTVVDSSSSFTAMEATKNLVFGAKTVEHPSPNTNEKKITNGELDHTNQQYVQYGAINQKTQIPTGMTEDTQATPTVLTFEFTEGKDIHEVRIYSDWSDNGRNGFEIDWVKVKYAGATEYVQLTTVPVLGYSDNANKSVGAFLKDSDGPLVKNVTGIRFHFNQVDNGYIGLGEVEIDGTTSSGGDIGDAAWSVVDSSTSFIPMAVERNIVRGAKTVEHPSPNDTEKKITNGELDYTGQQYQQYDESNTESQPATLTFEFNEATDIYEVRIFSAWSDNQRTDFGIDWVAVKYDEDGTYQKLSNVPALPYTTSETQSQRATLICSEGKIAKNVRGIQFHFNQCENHFIGLGEVEIAAEPPTGPAENSWSVWPSVKPASWLVGQPAGTIYPGKAVYGEVTCDHTPEQLNALLEGEHTVVFSVAPTANWKGLREEVKVEVVRFLGRNLIRNGGFENCTKPEPTEKVENSYKKLADCEAEPWIAGGSGHEKVMVARYCKNVQPSKAFWTSEAVGMSGTYCGVIEGVNGQLTQEITVSDADVYRFRCIAETRQYHGAQPVNLRIKLTSGSETITVVDGETVSSWNSSADDAKKPDGTYRVSKDFSLTPGTWTLTVQVEKPATGGADTLLLDDFELRALNPKKGLIISFSKE